MPTQYPIPRMDSAGKILLKFFPAAIARVADVVLPSLRGAANGVAPLDGAAKLPIDNAPPGAVLSLHFNGVAWPTARPTARTDITYWVDAPEGTPQPAWLLPQDDYRTF